LELENQLAGFWVRREESNDKRAQDADEADWLGSGEKPWKVNPGRGSKMK
jgi:hypothetical protein